MADTAELDHVGKRHAISALHNSPVAIVTKDLTGRITQWDDNAERLFGFERDKILGKDIRTIFPPGCEDEEDLILDHVRAGKPFSVIDAIRKRMDGSLVHVSLSVLPLKDQAGNVIGATKVIRDLAQEQADIAQITLRAREAEHRAKNILAAVMATVRLSEADTPGELKDIIAGRIRALAHVTSLTTSSKNGQADIETIFFDELQCTARDRQPRIYIEGPKLALDADKAQGLSMIVHELTTNSVKYGALSDTTSRLEIEWCASLEKVDVHWTELGLMNVQRPTREGFGSRLIRMVAESNLRGRASFFWRPSGLSFRLSFPIQT